MQALTPAPRLVRFGDFVLDLVSGELSTDGARVLLPEQPFRVLALLIARSGSVVTRDELHRELWPENTFVDFEHGLNAAVKRLRSILGDSAGSPRYIETLPRRGYRFVAAVDQASAAPGRRPGTGATAVNPWPGRRRTWVRWTIVASGAGLVMAAGSALNWMPPGAGRAPVLTPLAHASGFDVAPALSPDGSLVAYASDRGHAGASDIWLQALSGGEPLQLTSGPADEAAPSFSPDGGEIVFSRRDTGLYVVGVVGGTERLVTRQPWARTPKFSPDGRWIAYWTGFPASVVAGGIPGALGSIHIVPASGGTARVLPIQVASARYPVWSPDGEHILFLGEADEAATEAKRFDWYITNRDGTLLIDTGAVQAIRASGLRGSLPIPAAWNGADEAVAFATNEVGSSNIWQIPITSTGRIRGAPVRATFGTASERSPSVSPAGRTAFASVDENVDVYRVPFDSRTGAAAGPVERLTNSPARDRLLSVSEDGRIVAFVSSRTNADEVWLEDVDTGRERRATFSGSADATLHPDGSKLAFTVVDAGQSRLDVVDVVSERQWTICEACDLLDDWSPGGRRVLVGRGHPAGLWLFDVASRQASALASHPSWNLHEGRFSPDGRSVAFHTTNSPNRRQVYAVPVSPEPLDPSAWVPIVTDHGCHPNWSPDGSLVFHFSFRDGAFCPWVQRVDPATRRPIGAPRPVLHLHDLRLRAATGALATMDVQAGYLYFTATTATSSIWLLDRR
jgi:Tol biopolymer transport system component/DNA-binding winged helix-turn-helix (wHTH) protein